MLNSDSMHDLGVTLVCSRVSVKSKNTAAKLQHAYLVDPASSHMLVSKIKPCMSEFKLIFGEAANGSLYQL